MGYGRPLVPVVAFLAAVSAASIHLGPNPAEDFAKINISLEEYESAMASFLETRRQHAAFFEDIPELVTFDVDKFTQSNTMKYKVALSDDYSDVESSSLRLLLPPTQLHYPTTIRVRANEILPGHRLRFLDEKTLYLSNNSSKWSDFDVSAAVSSWIGGNPNLGIELDCLDCRNMLKPVQSAIVSLIHRKSRVRRAADRDIRMTDCEKGSGKRRKCCRHEMKVKLKKLPFPEMQYIVEPKVYEAGYCHGLCPRDYHPATNHSRIQGLLRQQMTESGGKKKIPKACCTPTKLGSLTILTINKDNPTKLDIKLWENMKVIECACS